MYACRTSNVAHIHVSLPRYYNVVYCWRVWPCLTRTSGCCPKVRQWIATYKQLTLLNRILRYLTFVFRIASRGICYNVVLRTQWSRQHSGILARTVISCKLSSGHPFPTFGLSPSLTLAVRIYHRSLILVQEEFKQRSTLSAAMSQMMHRRCI